MLGIYNLRSDKKQCEKMFQINFQKTSMLSDVFCQPNLVLINSEAGNGLWFVLFQKQFRFLQFHLPCLLLQYFFCLQETMANDIIIIKSKGRVNGLIFIVEHFKSEELINAAAANNHFKCCSHDKPFYAGMSLRVVISYWGTMECLWHLDESVFRNRNRNRDHIVYLLSL